MREPLVPRLLVVQHQDDAPLGRLDLGTGVDVVRPDRGEALHADVAGLDALVVLGGSMGATDDAAAPWLPATRRLLASAVAAGTPVLGLCLGAQLLAVATGGAVTRGPAGRELGVLPVEATDAAATDPLLAPLGRRYLVPQAHQDTVARLPRGAVLLASSAAYRVQAFRVGPSAWGLQYHPEVTAADWRAWMAEYADDVEEAGLDPAALAGDVDAHAEPLARLATTVGGGFAGLVARRADRWVGAR